MSDLDLMREAEERHRARREEARAAKEKKDRARLEEVIRHQERIRKYRAGKNKKLLDGAADKYRPRETAGEARDEFSPEPTKEPTFGCKRCNDRGWIIQDRAARECPCRIETRTERLLAAANLPPKFEGKTWKDFRTNHDNQRVAGMLAKVRNMSSRFVDKFMIDGKPRPTGLFFVGRPGCGKSHLATTVIQEVIKRHGVPALFVNFTVLINAIRNSYDEKSTEATNQVLHRPMNVPLVLIDEIGRERPTDHTMDILHLLLETRYLARLPTIFTANYPLKGRGKEVSLGERVSAPLVSRISEMAYVMEMRGAWDYRQEVLAHGNQP